MGFGSKIVLPFLLLFCLGFQSCDGYEVRQRDNSSQRNPPPAGKFQVEVKNGKGQGDYSPGERVEVEGWMPSSEHCLKGWVGDTEVLTSLKEYKQNFLMPKKNLSLEFALHPEYFLQVTNGAGEGSFCAGHPVSIKANGAPTGKEFSEWDGDSHFLENSESPSQTFAMPEQNVALRAVYTDKPRAYKVMPIGDSITHGLNGRTTYRCELWHLLTAQYPAIDFDFVGSMRGGYSGNGTDTCQYRGADFDHEGHWGWKADEVLSNMDRYLSLNVPDIVIIHLGTNDIRGGHSTQSTINEINAIIDKVRAKNPKASFLVSKIIPNFRDGGRHHSATRQLNAAVGNYVATKNTAQSRVLDADVWTGYEERDHYDGIHPGASGSKKMADVYFANLRRLLD